VLYLPFMCITIHCAGQVSLHGLTSYCSAAIRLLDAVQIGWRLFLCYRLCGMHFHTLTLVGAYDCPPGVVGHYPCARTMTKRQAVVQEHPHGVALRCPRDGPRRGGPVVPDHPQGDHHCNVGTPPHVGGTAPAPRTTRPHGAVPPVSWASTLATAGAAARRGPAG